MVSQMYGWMEGWIDGWIDSVSSRYSFVVSQMDGWMDGKCKFEIVFLVSLRYRLI